MFHGDMHRHVLASVHTSFVHARHWYTHHTCLEIINIRKEVCTVQANAVCLPACLFTLTCFSFSIFLLKVCVSRPFNVHQIIAACQIFPEFSLPVSQQRLTITLLSLHDSTFVRILPTLEGFMYRYREKERDRKSDAEIDIYVYLGVTLIFMNT